MPHFWRFARGRAAGPDVRALFPAGGQRGTTVEVSLAGKQEHWPVQTWVDGSGLTISASEEKGKLSIAVAPDAVPGLRWIRVYDATGTSPPRPFVVGTLGEVVETEGNNAPRTAQALATSSVIVNGKLGGGGDVDVFSLPLLDGQTLVASLSGHELLGSPMDAVLHVVSSAGYQLAYNHDRRGLDPEIVFTAPAAGTYLLRVFGFPSAPNSTIGFSGSDRHIYRLTVTTGGFVDYPWPLAVTRDQDTDVALVGWNIPDSLATVKVQAEAETARIADPQLANVAMVRVESHATRIETEPNGPDVPQAISAPLTVTGRIADREDTDVFVVEAKQGQPLEIQLESRELGYPLDGVLQIADEAGKSITKVDDDGGGRDPSTVFSPPADGNYRITVSDLNRHGSPRHVYRLRIVPATPAYEVTVDADSYTVEPDKPVEITLSISRQHGFAEEIAFRVTGLPDFITAASVKSAHRW